MYKYFEEYDKLEEEHGLRQVNGFKELNGCNNESCLFRTDAYKTHELTKEGILVVENIDAPIQKLDVDRYCIDVMLYVNEKTGEKTVGREAYFRGRVYHKVEEYAQNYIGMDGTSLFISRLVPHATPPMRTVLIPSSCVLTEYALNRDPDYYPVLYSDPVPAYDADLSPY
ncbi:hypothetical protein EVAR_48173_1 [Eumeta japonica]|uniref:Uncharacterized protein n=1 Tax=Eumeta variegata TaxID=151549 RepID=A0A4C1WQ55_EUMVA|nr:hypothetical protein EVAR_48173_1 [Eumeta japonica]